MQSLIAEHDLDLTEDEYALLISVCAHGAPWAQARAVLGSMSRELTGLQEGTLAAVQRYFRSATLGDLTHSVVAAMPTSILLVSAWTSCLSSIGWTTHPKSVS